MSDDLWDSCAKAVSRLESRLSLAIDHDIFPLTANDLFDTLPSVAAIVVSYPNRHALHVAGDRPQRSRDFECRAPVTRDSDLSIEIWLVAESELKIATRQAIGETIQAICGLLAGAVARIGLGESEAELDSLNRLSSSLFADGDSASRFHQLAVALASMLRVDRLSLLHSEDQHFHLVGSSVQPRFDPRADRVLWTQAVAKPIVLKLETGQHTVVEFDRDDDDAIESFLDNGQGDAVVATQFADNQFVAIGEVFDSANNGSREITALRRSLIDAALRDVARSRPTTFLHRGRAFFSRRSSRWRVAIAIGLLIFLTSFPMNVRVSADGRVVPRTQHFVYAPVTGQIDRMECETGSKVVAGQVLCEFSSHELELNVTRLRGEVITVQEQLQIAATRRGDGSASDVASDRRVLETRLRGLEQQIAILERRQGDFVVRSPITGIVSLVMPDELGTLNTPRPVELGQAVVRVINRDDGYRVELDVPDGEIGYVLAAEQRRGDAPVECRFRIRSQPERQLAGTLTRLDQSASLDRFGRLVVVATVEPAGNDASFSADAGVVGWIDCNRAAAGFVLCRKIIERLRLWGWL